MRKEQIIHQIFGKKSFLCVGLDTDITKIPAHIKNTSDPVFEFNKQVIQATADKAVAYKINTAFYECNGAQGWISMEKTANFIKTEYPDIFLIADAKRGDIGNTSTMYAKAFFQQMPFDAVTVAPYMGEDSVAPFLEFEGKWVILLALTSNKGAEDFQFTESGSEKLYEKVIKKSQTWKNAERLMYVIGATKADKLADIRKIAPDSFYLVPGVGAQGGSLQDVAKFGANENCGLLVNASRSILYADNSEKFALKAREEAAALQTEMNDLLPNTK